MEGETDRGRDGWRARRMEGSTDERIKGKREGKREGKGRMERGADGTRYRVRAGRWRRERWNTIQSEGGQMEEGEMEHDTE